MQLRSKIRWLASGTFLLCFSPVVGEFFVKLADEQGVYDRPTERAGAVMSWLTSQGWFDTALIFSAGLTLGVWIDWLLKRFDERARRSSAKWVRWDAAYRKIRAMQRRLERLMEQNPEVLPRDLDFEIISLHLTLSNLGFFVPLHNAEGSAQDILWENWDYLNHIAPFMRDRHRKAAFEASEIFVDRLKKSADQSPQLPLNTAPGTPQ